MVTVLPWSWQAKHVEDAAEIWNDRLGWRALGVHPHCPDDSDMVPWAFVRGLVSCGSVYSYGCTRSKRTANGVPYWREVEVSEDAPWTTLVHEWGHIVGCQHDDFGPPCI